ncbi:MAG TPA: peptide ABC transporter substrate-binding protein [Candidatus Saccharimonadales bacterium]|nr:peptide ABC transporter substrate-binding protein [Candidatus Saccharimonadales bacterium]
MNLRRTGRRLLIRLKLSRKQVENIGTHAEDSLDKLLLRRFYRLAPVRRFVLAWVGLLILLMGGVFYENLALSDFYQQLRHIPGGIYTEGVEGTFTNANPIYATSDADRTVSSLLFSGLLKTGADGNLEGDLASNYSVDSSEKVYTVHLRSGLKWQDGVPLTSRDVVFTFKTIENPDADSPLFSSWKGIDVSAPNADTVIFKLPDVLASFPNNLTTGIIPQHLLSTVADTDLRSDEFNTVHPVGSGPFEWQALQVLNGSDPSNLETEIALRPFVGYVGGSPKLDQFTVDVFSDSNQLLSAFESKNLTAMEGVDNVPASLFHKPGVVDNSFILRAADMVFFKTSSGVLADKNIRSALVQSANVPAIVKSLGYSTLQVREPLLMRQLGYNPAYAQQNFNLPAAKQLLDSDGWKVGKDGFRYKNGQSLSFMLTALNTTENQKVTNELRRQWQAAGVQLNVQLLNPTDFQSAISYHNYDALMTAVSIGTDPDVFVYWDSSQADIRSTNRLNFSEYNNPTADQALEAGRTRLDPAIRVIKYAPFLQAWQQDNPALGLYQPRLIYLTNGSVGGIGEHVINTPTDRFNNVQNWEIRETKVTTH